MAFGENLALVFVAGLITALATGLGALPFFVVQEFSDRWDVGLWGIASGIMLTVSVLGLVDEGLAYATGGIPILLIGGLLTGVVLVEVSDRLLDGVDFGGHEEHAPGDGGVVQADGGHEHDEFALEARAFAEGDLKKLALILGVLTVHSFPEGVAVGVSFAELGLDGGIPILGLSVPLLAVFMTVAIAIHNVPEGTAIAIPIRALGAPDGGWASANRARVSAVVRSTPVSTPKSAASIAARSPATRTCGVFEGRSAGGRVAGTEPAPPWTTRRMAARRLEDGSVPR